MPGSKYVYSNVGLNIAGRVIEKVSGVSYEQYVMDNILKPIGISPATMRIGGTTLADRATNEVVYYNPYSGYDQPYDFPVPRMDAHSGWTTTAVTLVRLLSYADGASGKPDILSGKLWQEMVTPTKVSIPAGGYAGYGLGWNASSNGTGVAYWHAGGMAGTATYWLKIGAHTFAILINTRSQANDFYSDIDQLCYQMTANLTLTNYMKGDQFDVFF
jgi:D-alanyl-D-alanine carboxypeptidase